MTDTNQAPSGTPQPHRRRRRDLSGTPTAVLGMLMMVKSGRVDPDMAAIACQVTRPTILQAIHRLRSCGLVIETHPTPPGPSLVQWYKLDDYSRPRAWELLAWWSEPDPDAWSRYCKQLPQEANHDTTDQQLSEIDEAHAEALLEASWRDTHW